MVFCPQHPKRHQNLQFTPLSETTIIPALSYGSPPTHLLGFRFQIMFSIKDTGQAAINFKNEKNQYFKKLGNLNVFMLGKEHGRPGCVQLQSRDKRVVSFLYFFFLDTSDNYLGYFIHPIPFVEASSLSHHLFLQKAPSSHSIILLKHLQISNSDNSSHT